MMDALQNIIRSFTFQETNNSSIFKVKDPQSFDDWFEQITKVAALTIKDPYELALAKSQGSFSRKISSFPPSMGWSKIREQLHYNFGSVATKQHAVSMLIDQQQKPSETLHEYIQRFSDLLLKSSGLLPHQAKDLTCITHFICNLHNQKLQHYVVGKNPNSVQNSITLAHKKDVELCIIEGFHNHDPGHKINLSPTSNITAKVIILNLAMAAVATI